jgi:hypothetical protein
MDVNWPAGIGIAVVYSYMHAISAYAHRVQSEGLEPDLVRKLSRLAVRSAFWIQLDTEARNPDRDGHLRANVAPAIMIWTCRSGFSSPAWGMLYLCGTHCSRSSKRESPVGRDRLVMGAIGQGPITPVVSWESRSRPKEFKILQGIKRNQFVSAQRIRWWHQIVPENATRSQHRRLSVLRSNPSPAEAESG